MSKLTTVFAATSLALAVVSGWLWQQLREERAINAQLNDRPVVPEVRTAPEVRMVVNPVADPEPAPATPPPPLPPPQTAPTIIVTQGGVNMPGNDASILQRQMNFVYPDLAEQLGMTPEQAEALFDLLQKQQSALVAASLAAGAGTQDAAEFQRLRDNLVQQQEADLAAHLGPAHQQQWEQYRPTLEARRRISELHNMVASSGDPITSAQKQQLLNTILAEQQRRAGEESLRAYPNMDQRAKLDMELQNLKGREESYRRTQQSASAYLTPAQFAAMKTSQDRLIESSRRALEAQRAALEGAR
jgi:hypothetical protein